MRFFCALLAGVVMLALPALAQDYPNRTIRLISGYPPGATSDIAARILADAIGTRIGGTIVVESKPGADSEIAVDFVAKAPPDGYVLLYANNDATSMAVAEKPRVPYRIPEDLSYIARTIQVDFNLVVNPKLPVHSLAEFIAYARANPGKLRYGSAGVGSAGDVERLMLMQQAGITLVHVPYRGSVPAMIDTLAGVIDVSFQSLPTLGDNATNGKLRLLVNFNDTRNPKIPDVPSIVEAGYPHAVMNAWLGILGPAKMPVPVLQKLRKAAADTMADPAIRDRFTRMGVLNVPLIGDDFQKLVADEVVQYSALLKEMHYSVGKE